MKVTNDDDVHRFMRVFVDFRGWNIGEIVKARYVAWGCWAAVSGLLFVTILARTLGGVTGAMWSAAIGVGVTMLASPYLTNEVGPLAWYQAGRDEARSLRVAQARSRRLAEAPARWTPGRKS